MTDKEKQEKEDSRGWRILSTLECCIDGVAETGVRKISIKYFKSMVKLLKENIE